MVDTGPHERSRRGDRGGSSNSDRGGAGGRGRAGLTEATGSAVQAAYQGCGTAFVLGQARLCDGLQAPGAAQSTQGRACFTTRPPSTSILNSTSIAKAGSSCAP